MNQENSSLVQAGLVEGKIEEHEPESPWYIKALLAFSGWLGAWFLVVFVAITFGRVLEDSAMALLIIGGGLIAFSYSMFIKEKSEFLEHFALAISITGQVMVIAGVMFLFKDKIDAKIFLFVGFFQAFLMWLMPNYIHRMLSSLFMALSFSYSFYEFGEPFLYLSILTFVVAWLWLNEFNFMPIRKIQAIAYGQLIALLWLKSTLFYGYQIIDFYSNGDDTISFSFSPWTVEIASALTLAYVVWKILEQNHKLEEQKTVLLSFVGVGLLGLLSLEAHGLVLGLILLLIGFFTSHRLLMGLGVVTLLFFISNYYYFMGETLIDKAKVLALMGVLLLMARWVLVKIIAKEKQDV